MTGRWPGLLAAAITVALSGAAKGAPACAPQPFEGSTFTVCAYDAGAQGLSLVRAGPNGVPFRGFGPLSKQLRKDRARVRFAMNAGMFDANGYPIGLYVEAGRTLHPLNTADGAGNFYRKPNGVFWIGKDGEAHITTADAFARTAPAVEWATQSGPMLVIDGALHPAIAQDGASRNIRNGVGTCQGRTLFVISEQPVSFGRLARFFRDALRCESALYLDGAISSLWWPDARRMDEPAKLGPMVLVED